MLKGGIFGPIIIPFDCAVAVSILAACTSPAPLVSAPVPVVNPPGAPWRNINESTGKVTDLHGLTALASAFPESASVQRRLLTAALREQNSTLARAALQRLEAMGYALGSAAFDALRPIIGDVDAKTAQLRAEALRRPVGTSTDLATVPPDHRLIEGLAWDARRNRLYVTSVIDQRLVAIEADGVEVPEIDGGSLFGLAIDEPRRLLWIASGVVEQSPSSGRNFRGLIAMDLNSGRVVRRIPSPVSSSAGSNGDRTKPNAPPPPGPSLGDIAVGPDGTVYASDPTGGGVYSLRPGASAIETLISPGVLRSPQGIAVHPRGDRIYISDYAYGIALFDLGHHNVGRLAANFPVMMDGIDGLYWSEGGLVGIQNGTSPMRIVRIRLDDSGETATGLTVVEASSSNWGEPTNGQVVGNGFVYVSEPQWDRFGPGGALKGSEPLRPNRIRVTPLAAGSPEPPRSN